MAKAERAAVLAHESAGLEAAAHQRHEQKRDQGGTAMMSFFLPSSRLIIETTTQYSVAYTAAVAIVKPIMIM